MGSQIIEQGRKKKGGKEGEEKRGMGKGSTFLETLIYGWYAYQNTCTAIWKTLRFRSSEKLGIAT